MAGARPQVVIVGAGFGGLATARSLADAPVDGTLVDRHNFHTFQPLLYQVATSGLASADVLSVSGAVMAAVPSNPDLGAGANSSETAYAFVENATVAAVLYVVDHAFFAMAIALKTYFQKIADPADIAPTSGVAFTISHIAAVFLPFVLGIVWLTSPSAVFLLGASLAFCSLVLSRLVPRHPEPGREVLWRPALARSAT